MSDREFDDIFDGNVGDNSENTEVETTETETVTETVEAPVTTETPSEVETAETEQTTEAQREETERVAPPSNWVPNEAMIAERRKAQAAAQRAAELEARVQELEAQSHKSSKPSQFENEEGYEQWLLEEAKRQALSEFREEQARQQQQLAMQQQQAMFQNFVSAAPKHTPDEIQNAAAYADAYGATDDAWMREVLAATDPIARILEDQNRHAQEAAELEEFRRDRAGYVARKAAEMGIAGAAASGVAPATQPHMAATAKAPRSLASAGGGTPETQTFQTETEAFDAIFNSKR